MLGRIHPRYVWTFREQLCCHPYSTFRWWAWHRPWLVDLQFRAHFWLAVFRWSRSGSRGRTSSIQMCWKGTRDSSSCSTCFLSFVGQPFRSSCRLWNYECWQSHRWVLYQLRPSSLAGGNAHLSFCSLIRSIWRACTCTRLSKCGVCCRTHIDQSELCLCLQSKRRTLACWLRQISPFFPSSYHRCTVRCPHMAPCFLQGTLLPSFLQLCSLQSK